MRKHWILPLCVLGLLAFSSQFRAGAGEAEKAASLSTHILDIAIGKPAEGVEIELFKQAADKTSWVSIKKAKTDANGRIRDFLENKPGENNIGVYKFTFYTKAYFDKQNRKSFYPYIDVIFSITDTTHYHVPITLSDFGYSTYRGS